METNQNSDESAESLKRRAYHIGFKLKNSGLEPEVVYARLEKAGIPAELARQVTTDVMVERAKTAEEEQKPFEYTALIKIGVGVVLAGLCAFLFPGQLIIPIGLILGGIVYFLVSKN